MGIARAIIRPLALQSTKFPIESIVATFVFVTLAYFHLLSAIKNSAFLASPSLPHNLRPTYALRAPGNNAWITVPDEDHPVAELLQVVFESPKSNTPSLDTPAYNVSHYLLHEVQVSDGATYSSSLCYQVDGKCFVAEQPSSLTLAFKPGAHESWSSTLRANASPSDSHPTFRVDPQQTESIGEMRSGKWIAYAIRALVVRFYELTMQADSADILVVLLGYILMHGTFIRLFLAARKVGSNIWLPTSVLCSGISAFIVSVPIALYLAIPLDLISLTEAMPFFVITIGFDKPLQLARAVFSHPQFSTSVSSVTSQSSQPVKPARGVVLDAVEQVGESIVRDYAIEVFVLLVGASSKVSGLKEFCALAALILTVDCVALFTFYVAVLTVLVEVHRIKALRGSSRPATSPLKRLSRSLLGEKGVWALSGQAHNDDEFLENEPENPAARLKLLLIVSFLTLHILNLCTTLTPDAALARHQTHANLDVDSVASRKVDITAPTWAGVLSHLGEQIQAGEEQRVVMKIVPPVYLRLSPPVSHASQYFGARFERFMSLWTRLVEDPVLSKWIVFVLALSVLLNGYLLKGLAATAAQAGESHPRNAWISGKRQFEETVIVKEPSKKLTPAEKKPVSPIASSSSAPVEPPRTRSTRQSLSAPVPQLAQAVVAERKVDVPTPQGLREFDECMRIFESGEDGVDLLNDEEIIMLSQKGKIAAYALEKVLRDFDRAVRVRRALISRASDTKSLEGSNVPMDNYDYSRVLGACCENVVGYMPIPLGIAGPLIIDGKSYPIPMATAEGTLVASTSRGCKALNVGGGVTTVLTRDGMTRGPALDFPSVTNAARAQEWIESASGAAVISEAFNSTSRFARLQGVKTALAGRTLYVRFSTTTGDAMGMNMISKGVERALEVMQTHFPEMEVLALSGNYCTDKKPAAINWIEGRGKSVVAEAVVPGKTVKSVLKTTVEALCKLNMRKNLVGSAMAGSIGGFNAHAANILTAMFLATGQDPAQNVESSNCMTLMEPINNGEDLHISVTMPSIEVGTVGGGTVLAPQQAVLDMLGLRGAHAVSPGANAQTLARIIAAAVMAGELSLMSALAAGHLIRAHLQHNRSQPVTPAVTRPVSPTITPLRLERERTVVVTQMMRDSLRVTPMRTDYDAGGAKRG